MLRRRSEVLRIQRTRSATLIRAAFCMLAVALLYAPFAAAVISARAAACCTSGHCPIPQHHRHSSHAAPASPMDCRHNMSSAAECSLSCCHTPERAFLFPVAFLLPHVTPLATPACAMRASQAREISELPRTIEPPSPPPRLSTSLS